MGLISKTIKMKWCGTNSKYYKEKGYAYTKRYDEFEVKVEDLANGSHALIDIQCDSCGKLLKSIEWRKYKKRVKKENTYFCSNCTDKSFRAEKTRVTKLLKGESFGYWIIKNFSLRQAVSIIARWDKKLNKCDIRDIGYGSHGFDQKGYWFKCPKGIHSSELKNIHNFTRGHNGVMDCNMCNSFAQWGIDNLGQDFLEKYWDYDKNNKLGLDPWKISKGSCKKVYIFCQEHDYHGSYFVVCDQFVNNGYRCYYCSNKKIHKYDSLGWLYPQVFKIWSDKNKKSPFEYAPKSSQKVWWKCPDGKHKDYKRIISVSNVCEFRCPECIQERNESMIQEKTRLYLEENYNQYEILHEGKCTLKPKNLIDPPNNSDKKRGKGILRYDNEIIINNNHFFIEVMGLQHKKESSLFYLKSIKKYNTTPEQELKYLQDRDEYKKEYVYNQGNNYYYLAIWYYHFDKQDTYKTLINNKINEILDGRHKEII